ncbi:MAG: NUDIX hydrolase [Lachnospiraceae bacterium]|nr:NUDIX hydrolase [Lachnospiraceae bacterium]
MDITVKRIGRELKYQGRIVDFYADIMELPDGRTTVWDYIEHRKCAAAVVPVLPDGRLLLVRQYRNAVERTTLEIPAGARDSLEEPYEVCAARELEEETGYRCEKLEFLISTHSAVAYCNERVDIFVARDLVPASRHLDPDEFVDVEAYTLEELCAQIYEGKLQDAKTVAAIMAYNNKYQPVS